MTPSQVDLAELFSTAQKTMAAHRQEINDLDGYNGNHGDNMAANVQLIVEALQEHHSDPPAAALEHASQRIRAEGRGGTSPYYAKGLTRAADQVKGRSGLTTDDALTIVQSLLSSIPSDGHPEDAPAGGSVLDLILGMTQGPRPAAREQGSPLGGLLKTVIPAALSLLQRSASSKTDSEGSASGMGGLLLEALAGSQEVSPLQSDKPRAAAGGLLAQSLLKALSGRQ